MAGKAEALEALLRLGRGAVEKIDLGDMARLDIPERVAALGKMVSKPAKKIDDWGWKGGKPGEITGSQYFIEREKLKIPEYLYTPQDWDKKALNQVLSLKESDPIRSVFERRLINRLTYLPEDKATKHALDDTMMDFAMLELSGVPRKWTGKILRAIGGAADDQVSVENISSLMRTMADSQREDFLRLLPRSKVPLETLAETVKRLRPGN